MTDPDGVQLKLSVVIPAYNEQLRIVPTLEGLKDFARRRPGPPIEVIVVDDGSRDATAELVRGFPADPLELRVLVNETNRGKGYSVRRGMLNATGDLLVMSDADLSTPPQEVDKALPWVRQGYEVVIGSRDMADSIVDPPQTALRRLFHRSSRLVRRRIMLPELRDTQCGFKVFTRNAAQRIFPLQECEGFAFDCEILALALKLGVKVKEIGIVWRNKAGSTVHPFRDSIRMFRSLLRIRKRMDRLQ